MLEIALHGGPLPDIQAMKVCGQWPNFRVVADYESGLEQAKGSERFFVEPTSSKGVIILQRAARAHNFFNFSIRPHPDPLSDVLRFVPCLRVAYLLENIPPLFQGRVVIPLPGQETVPSVRRMEECIDSGQDYSFADGLPSNYGIPDPRTRDLCLLQAAFLDEIPQEIIHSTSPNPWYKARKGWWQSVTAYLEAGVKSGEFSDPEIVKRIGSFLTNYLKGDFSNPHHLVTADDIFAANRLIHIILFIH